MAYEKTIWKNREVERPRTFRQQNNPDGTVTLIPEEGQIIEPGTPIIADNMNKIEDAIEGLFTSVSNGKQVVADAITGKGVPTSATDPFQQMADNISDITTGEDTSDATATAGDILAGKTAYANGKITGAMPNNGPRNGTITTQGGQIAIPAGYTTGGTISAQFPNLSPANVRRGVNIGGVIGTLESIPNNILYFYGASPVTFVRGQGSGTSEHRADHLYLRVSASAGASNELSFVTNAPVNLTGVSRLIILSSYSSNGLAGDGNAYFVASTIQNGYAGTYNARTTVYGTYASNVLDVSNLSGDYYIRAHAKANGGSDYSVSATLQIYGIWIS